MIVGYWSLLTPWWLLWDPIITIQMLHWRCSPSLKATVTKTGPWRPRANKRWHAPGMACEVGWCSSSTHCHFKSKTWSLVLFPAPVCSLSVKCVISHQKPCLGYSCLLFIAAFTWDWQEGHTDLQLSRCCLQSQFCKKWLVPFCVTLLLMSIAKCPVLVFVDKSFKLGLVLTMDIFNIIGKNDVKKHLMTIWYSCL